MKVTDSPYSALGSTPESAPPNKPPIRNSVTYANTLRRAGPLELCSNHYCALTLILIDTNFLVLTCDSGAYCCVFSDGGKLIVAGNVGGHLHFLRLVEPRPNP